MTDKLRLAAETAIWNLEAIATSDWRRWEDSATPEKFEAWVKHKADYAANALRQALAEPPNSATNVVEPESTQAQELFGKTEQLKAEIKRLQELADYRLKLLTKMPSEWVGLTDEDMEGMFLNDDGIRIARYIEARIKELNT